MLIWVLLLALIIFFIYWWGVGKQVSGGAECGACAQRKNVQPVE